jgi:hypothetical protein
MYEPSYGWSSSLVKNASNRSNEEESTKTFPTTGASDYAGEIKFIFGLNCEVKSSLVVTISFGILLTR